MVLMLSLLGACATAVEEARRHIAEGEWMKAVLVYREALAKDPDSIELRSRLRQVELKAADHYYQLGARRLETSDIEGAIVQFQQGLAAKPDHSKLLQAMSEALGRKEAQALYDAAVLDAEGGKKPDAIRSLKRVLDAYPDHKEAKELLAKLQKELEVEQGGTGLALRSRAPITLNFRQTEIKTAFDFIAKSFGIDIIFDEAVKSTPVNLFAKDVTFEQALELALTTTKTFYKRIGPNTILIAPDTKEKRGQYEDQIVRTFQVSNIKAKEMGDIIKGLFAVKKMIVNERLNTIIVRDTEDVLELIERTVQANDRKPAEMILDVELLEVSRTKAERLGLDFGSEISLKFDPFTVSDSWRQALKAGTVMLPPVTFRYFKQDVDAKALANPRIRVIDGKAAKIHIGDRVPLRTSTVRDPTGSVFTNFQYADIGIKLAVEPTIHLDNSSTVKLSLEVSVLGPNLGTPKEPAYSIGTRNADTFMLLRDGETAILGGLIRDSEREGRTSVPGFGDIPLVGRLFQTSDDSAERTDVLLTITPRVVRGWDLPVKQARAFHSGTENRYMTKPLFAQFDSAPVGKSSLPPELARVDAPPTIVAVPGTQGGTKGVPPGVSREALPPVAAVAPGAVAAGGPQPVLLAFSEAVYEVNAEQEVQIGVTAQHLADVDHVPMEILFNPQLLKFVRGEAGDLAPKDIKLTADEARGVLRIDATMAEGATATQGTLAKVTLRAAKPGISYLVYRAPTLSKRSGGTVTAQVRASRIVIR